MSTNWTAYDFKRDLADAVATRAGITGLTPTVRVLTYFPSPDEPLTDAVIVGHTLSDTKEKVTVGGHRHDETVQVECQVRIARPGAGQDVASSAEDRAETILAEIDDEVRTNAPSVGNQTLTANLSDRTSSLFSWDTGDVPLKVCIVEFTVTYKARTSA